MQLGQRLHRQVGVHRLGAVAGQHREVVHLAREPVSTTRPAVVRRPSRTRWWWMADSASSAGMATWLAVHAPVGDDEDVVAALDGVHRLGAQRRQLGLDALAAPGQRVGDVELVALELAVGVLLDRAQARHVVEVEHRLLTSRRIGGLTALMSSRLGLGPMKLFSDITMASRIGSIGGLVTWANSCLK
jgi:hypothetical protein